MRRKKRTEIVIETRQLLAVRGGASAVLQCPTCAPSATMITPEEAAALARTSQHAIHHLLEAGRVHFIDTARRTKLICLNSLLAHLKEGRKPD